MLFLLVPLTHTPFPPVCGSWKLADCSFLPQTEVLLFLSLLVLPGLTQQQQFDDHSCNSSCATELAVLLLDLKNKLIILQQTHYSYLSYCFLEQYFLSRILKCQNEKDTRTTVTAFYLMIYDFTMSLFCINMQESC